MPGVACACAQNRVSAIIPMKKTCLLTTVACLLALGASHASEPVAPPAAVPASTLSPAVCAHPYLSKGLYPRWSRLTPQQGLVDIRFALDEAKKQMEAICCVEPGAETYGNTFAAYERMGESLDVGYGLFRLLCSVMDSPERRAVQEVLIPDMSAFASSVTANERLWAVIKRAAVAPWVQELAPEQQRYVQQVVDSFRDSGADLSPEGKARQAAIMQELSQLSNKYAKNILDATAAWQLVIADSAELDGCSPAWMEAARAAAAEKGLGSEDSPRWLVTLAYTSFGEVMRNCHVEATRRACWEGQAAIGKGGDFDNEAIVARVMELRRELAALLGFANYADLTTAHRMVPSGAAALAFIDGLMQSVKPAFDRESEEVLAYVSARKGHRVDSLAPWDRRYYTHQLSKERYSFDPEQLRPYFPCDRVVKGMFSIFEGTYGISLSELPTACVAAGESCPEGAVEVWHPEVRLFKVEDAATGTHLGSFYMDLFPREVKRAGAWVQPIAFGEPASGGKPHAPHLALLAGNLSPAAAEGEPALLSHYDVQVLFHEFGHMMHCMLGDAALKSHMGTCVAWDFVELPSQLLENYTWEPESLALISAHHETGEALPSELVEKLRASRHFLPASSAMGQLCIGKLDLEMHMNYAEKFEGRPLDEATDALLEPWRMPMTVSSPSLMRNLSHCISGGYAAGYYSYKWAKVLAADAWSRFEKEGILNPATGADFRRAILERGDSRPAAELYRGFMKRDPDPDALLRSCGLLPAGE